MPSRDPELSDLKAVEASGPAEVPLSGAKPQSSPPASTGRVWRWASLIPSTHTHSTHLRPSPRRFLPAVLVRAFGLRCLLDTTAFPQKGGTRSYGCWQSRRHGLRPPPSAHRRRSEVTSGGPHRLRRGGSDMLARTCPLLRKSETGSTRDRQPSPRALESRRASGGRGITGADHGLAATHQTGERSEFRPADARQVCARMEGPPWPSSADSDGARSRRAAPGDACNGTPEPRRVGVAFVLSL